jgi:hypothetical protein
MQATKFKPTIILAQASLNLEKQKMIFFKFQLPAKPITVSNRLTKQQVTKDNLHMIRRHFRSYTCHDDASNHSP